MSVCVCVEVTDVDQNANIVIFDSVILYECQVYLTIYIQFYTILFYKHFGHSLFDNRRVSSAILNTLLGIGPNVD